MGKASAQFTSVTTAGGDAPTEMTMVPAVQRGQRGQQHRPQRLNGYQRRAYALH